MPTIKPSVYLCDNYNDISNLCHSRMEPVFITKDGHGDLAVMSIEAYEKFCGRYELHYLLEEGLEDEKCGKHNGFDEFMTKFWEDVT